ncbi:MAG TPA: extracellular solute-binding protein, partial [Limnochordia bacterium]
MGPHRGWGLSPGLCRRVQRAAAYRARRTPRRRVAAVWLGGLVAALAVSVGGLAAPTELVLTHWWGTTAGEALEESLFPAFERRFPVELKQQMFSWGEYYDKWVVTSAAGKPMGDVILVDAKFAQDMFAAGPYFVDLQPLLRRDRIDARRFSQAALRQFSPYADASGTLYALPIVSGTVVPFYNRDALAGAGVAAPDASWSWDQFFATASELRRMEGASVTRYGFGGWHQGILEAMIPSYGGRLLSPDRTEPALESPIVVDALIRLREMRASNVYGGDFPKGTAVFHFTGDWDPGWWGELPFGWGIMPMPSGPAGRYTTAWSNGLAIPSTLSGDKLDLAWEFVKFYAMNPERLGVPDIYLNMM